MPRRSGSPSPHPAPAPAPSPAHLAPTIDAAATTPLAAATQCVRAALALPTLGARCAALVHAALGVATPHDPHSPHHLITLACQHLPFDPVPTSLPINLLPADGFTRATLLARAYEAALDAHAAGPALGAVYTPAVLARRLADLALSALPSHSPARTPTHSHPPLHACDPACGTGHLLLALRESLAASSSASSSPLTLRVTGVDIDPLAVVLCRAVLAFHQPTSPHTPAPLAPTLPDRLRDAAASIHWGDALLGHDWRTRARLAPTLPTTTPPSDLDAARALLDHHAHALGSDPAPIARDSSTPPLHHWPLEHPHTPRGFDIVLANPPFLSQLTTSTARSRHAAQVLHHLFRGSIRGYSDSAAAFLLRGLNLTRPQGVCAMILPASLLATRDAAPVRRHAARAARLAALWIDDGKAFRAKVHACAVVLTTHSRPRHHPNAPSPPPPTPTPTPSPVDLFAGATASPVRTIAASPRARWATLAAFASGVPPVPLLRTRTTPRTPRTTPTTFAELLDAAADFRDLYYSLRGLIIDLDSAPNPAPPAPIRIVTSGMIDLARLHAPTRPVRILGQSFARPALPPNAPPHNTAFPAVLRKAIDSRCVPKLMLATQTRILEAAIDSRGDCLPITPVITLVPRPAAPDLWTLAAMLCAPTTTMLACRRTFGTAMTTRAIKLAARDVRDLPLPGAPDRFAAAASDLRTLAAADSPAQRHDALRAFATSATRAADVAPRTRAIAAEWWLARALPARSQ